MVRKVGDMKQPTKKELRERIAALEAENAAACERGAREFAEWYAVNEDNDWPLESIPDFLASRGTGIAEAEGKKEG